MIKDLTVGRPESVLFRFSIPMFISVMFQQLYSIADSIIAGRFAGEDALAAVGASYPITMIFMAIAIGCNIGCAVVISNLFGAKKYKEMKTAVSTTLLASLVLSVVLTVLGVLFTSPLMRLVQTPENIFEDGALFLRIYTGGFVFLFLYNVCTGIFQSLGDSKTPLWFLIGSSVGNIVLDFVFVAGLHWGVAGVGWATFIAQGAACLLSYVTLMKRLKSVQPEVKAELFSMNMLARIGRIAVPSILQQSFVSVGNMFIQGIINTYGSSVIAGYSASIKLNTFCITSFTTLSNGLSSFTAQNLGAGKPDRVRKGFRAGSVMAAAIALLFFGLYFFAGKTMVGMFLDSSSQTAGEVGTQFLKIVSPFYCVVAVKLMADGVLRGMGNVAQFMIATFSDLVTRVILAFVLTGAIGITGVWVSWPTGWVLAVGLSLTFYVRSMKRAQKNVV